MLFSSLANSQENLYTVEAIELVVRDQTTGGKLWSTSDLYLARTWGLGLSGTRLLALDVTGWNPENQTLLIHPADASETSLGNTGQKWKGFAGIDVDPTSGIVYASFDSDLYTLDLSTGALVHKAFLIGMKPGDGLGSLAIDANGVAYGSGLFGSPALYQIHLPTGSVTNLGVIEPLSISIGDFQDLAFDASGQLWGAYTGDANLSGLYKIDVDTVSAERIVFGNLGIRGMAFGPATPEAVYCTPKVGSTGCIPTIRSTGVASPTASLGYDVFADGVRNSSYGMLVYSTLGPASTPFAGGTLCVTSPWKRTQVVHSGGSPPSVQDCSGTWSYDLNTHFANKPGPAPGDTVWCQWLGRDPGFAQGQAYALSDALQFTLLP